ncbi:MAG: NYN domain-containing protein [Clostridia bacterium]
MNYAILYDLGAVRISFQMFQQALASLDGRVAYVKLYGYNAKRHAEYTEFVKKYSAYVDVPLANRKKVRVDIRQVIDATALAVANKNIDGFFLISSPIDSMPMVRMLRENGKKVVIGVESPNFVSQQCDETIVFDRSSELNIPQSEVASDCHSDNSQDGNFDTNKNVANSLDKKSADRDALVDKLTQASSNQKISVIKAKNSRAQESQITTFESDNTRQITASKSAQQDNKNAEIKLQVDNLFLPYSSIQGAEVGMEDVKDTLVAMIDNKRKEKSKLENSDGVVALEELLKKYF